MNSLKKLKDSFKTALMYFIEQFSNSLLHVMYCVQTVFQCLDTAFLLCLSPVPRVATGSTIPRKYLTLFANDLRCQYTNCKKSKKV